MDSQHYVPRLLLKHFVFGTKQVFVFDKQTERPFPKAIKKVACGVGFDDCEVGGEPFSIDPLLKKIENQASPIIDSLVAMRSLRVLSGPDKKMLALFATVQMLRTDGRRKELKGLIDSVRDAVERAGIDPSKVQGFEFLDMEQTRVAAITSLPELARDLLPEFLNKSLILYSTTEEHPFYISDNPVVRFNLNQDPLRSTLGLRTRGIQIYLPISSTLCLGFLCPSINLPLGVRFLGRPLSLSPANVEHFNSLEVLNAEQFVYSKRDDFALVHAMFSQMPEAKRGPRCA